MLYFSSFIIFKYKLWPYRLSVRTQDFQSWKPGSIPGRVTDEKSHKEWFFIMTTYYRAFSAK